MEHVDTLQAYEDLVASGVPDVQAKAHVRALNSSFDSVVTTKDLKILENDLKIFFTWEIGAVLLITFILPKIGKKWGWFN